MNKTRIHIWANLVRVGSFLIIWLLMILAFYRLGAWQLDRANQVANPPIKTVGTEPIEIEKISQPGINIRLSAVNRIVILKGEYVASYLAPNQNLVSSLKDKKVFDVRVMRLESGNHVLVARRILLPSEIEPLAINQRVIVVGRLYPNQNVDRVALSDGVLSRIDPALVVSKKFPFFYDGYVVLQSEKFADSKKSAESFDSSLLIPSPVLSQKVPGFYWQHISYVVVWWFMAFLVVIAPLFKQFRPKLIRI
jgi:cytochrome oxidase assembly protein ShyY1